MNVKMMGILVGGIGALTLLATLAVAPVMGQERRPSNGESAVMALKSLRDAETVFKEEDSDRNTINDFWTADVSGLYRVLNAAGNEIKKIPIDIAKADGAPMAAIANYVGTAVTATPVPYRGYYFRAMTTDETGSTYHINAIADAAFTQVWLINKFAFCAYPATYDVTGRNTFIVSQEGTVWTKDTGTASAVLTWPATNPKSAGWSAVD